MKEELAKQNLTRNIKNKDLEALKNTLPKNLTKTDIEFVIRY
ncbi:MAG: hypothetical protein N2203_02075 [Bacteroidia bacterium]|nr:hypothetical protein [Bacteroidia bacterium]